MFFNRVLSSSFRASAVRLAGAGSVAYLAHSSANAQEGSPTQASKMKSAIQCQAPSVTWKDNQAYLRPNTPGSKAQYPFVVVGMGTAAYSAISAIRANKPEAEILMLVDEKLVQSHASVTSISTDLLSSYNEWRRGSSAASAQTEQYIYRTDLDKRIQVQLYSSLDIDAQTRTLKINGGDLRVVFHRCLVATAGSPLVSPGVEQWSRQDSRVNTLSTPSDWMALDMLGSNIPVLVNGGGLLGTEVACSLRKKGHEVVLAFPEDGLLRNYIPKHLSFLLSQELANKAGITLKPGTPPMTPPPVDQLEAPPNTLSENLGTNVDYFVLAGTYVQPDVSVLARSNAFVVDPLNGAIKVNKYLEAGNGVFVAGNSMSYDDVLLGKHRRAQRFDHAVQSGLVAGHNMSSGTVCATCNHHRRQEQQLYEHQPVLHSALNCDSVSVNMLGVGEVDGHLAMAGLYLQGGEQIESVVYYLDNTNKIVGTLLCNMGRGMDIASSVLGKSVPAGADVADWIKSQVSAAAKTTGREDIFEGRSVQTTFDKEASPGTYSGMRRCV